MIICIGPFCIPVVWGLPFFAALFVSLKSWLTRLIFGTEAEKGEVGKLNLPERTAAESVKVLKAESELHALQQSGKKALLYFTAAWCGPCQKISPVVDDLSARFSEVAFVKIDVDEFQDLAETHDVSAMPTFVLVEGTIEHGRLRGADASGLQELLCRTLESKKQL